MSAAVAGSSQSNTDGAVSFDWSDQESDGTEDRESPWQGAVIYRRNSLVSHVEYCTTLERLGLEKLSTDTSKSRASAMGLRVTKTVKDYPLGTPVQISVDMMRRRKKKKLRLDGIIRTVITLGCNRLLLYSAFVIRFNLLSWVCFVTLAITFMLSLLVWNLNCLLCRILNVRFFRCGDPAAEPVYSNFSLLLTEEPIEEPEILNMGTIFGEDKSEPSPGLEDVEEEDDADIDMDDWLYFPAEEKEIDISKHIRDLVHLEITLNAVCNPGCKGLCLRCGTNLNMGMCSCSDSDVRKKDFGPLGNLRKQMQQQK